MEKFNEFFTKADKKKCDQLGVECSPTDENDGYVYNAAKRMAIHKNKEFSGTMRRHEESLLFTVESILDTLMVEGEAREIALDEFKSHLTNKF